MARVKKYKNMNARQLKKALKKEGVADVGEEKITYKEFKKIKSAGGRYTPEYAIQELMYGKEKHVYHKDANIYGLNEYMIRSLITNEWIDTMPDKTKGETPREYYERVWGQVMRSTLITPVEERGKNNFIKNLIGSGLMMQLQNAIQEPVDRNNLHALDDKSWVYWMSNGEALRISFYNITTGGSLYTPTISLLDNSKRDQLKAQYGGRV